MSPIVANLATGVRRAIYGAMAGDAPLNSLLSTRRPSGRAKSIYYAYAPDGAGAPYVIFNKQSGTPTYTFKSAAVAGEHSHALVDNEIWLIKGVAYDGPEIVAEDPMDAADNIASRLDALLTDVTISISGATELYLRRDSDVAFAETADGETYYHSGGLYRLIYSAT